MLTSIIIAFLLFGGAAWLVQWLGFPEPFSKVALIALLIGFILYMLNITGVALP